MAHHIKCDLLYVISIDYEISTCYTEGMSLVAPSIVCPPRRKRRFVRETPDAFQLTERDVHLVHLVAQHRFLRSTHLSLLCAAPHKKICDRLTVLFHAGYLDRPRAQLDHYREGGGSASMVYALGCRGAQLLGERLGQEAANVDWTRKNDQAGRQFILHTLAIADVRIALQCAIRTRPGFRLIEPDELLAMAPVGAQSRERPWSFRTLVRVNDQQLEIGLEPDYAFAIQYPDGRFRAFLVECDRGTMPVDRASLMQSSLKRKFLAYAAAKRAELQQHRLGWKTFRVLLVTSSAQRAQNALDTIRANIQEHLRGLFLVADREAVVASDIIAHAWADPRGQTLSLV